MKKWFPAFLFLSLSGGNDALAGSTMFFSFNDSSYMPQRNIRTTQLIQFDMDIPSASRAATVSYKECNGFTWTYGLYWSEYFAWLVVPKRISHNGYNIYLELQALRGLSLDAQDADNYYFTYGISWDAVNSGLGGRSVCYDIGTGGNFNWPYGTVTMNARLPADLPKGDYTFPLKYLRGIQRNNFDHLGGRYKIPSSLMKTFNRSSTQYIQLKSIGGCTPSVQSLEINHGDVSIDKANSHYASQTFSVYCDVPTNIRFSLLSNTTPIYSHGQKFAVGLGHGWDSIVSINGTDTGSEILRWGRAGTQSLTIGSRLYGESSKIQPGELSGSATLIMVIP
ncbi:fimbrial protein [Escherichia coli]|nr:fimbrial protein [Escherichia coli]